MALRYVTDLAAAQWIKPRLHAFATDVGSLVPEGFAEHARIFHPAHETDVLGRPVSWAEIAIANGRQMHPEVQFGSIAGTWSRRSPQPDLWVVPPRTGSLSVDLARALVAVLEQHLATADRCWFAVWEGWQHMRPTASVPTIELPHRRYYLAEGAIEDATRSVNGTDQAWTYQSASMWWPDDHAWFVSTEVDLMCTYVAGSKECIDAVLGHPQIEALRARITDGITSDSDRRNPSVPITR